MLADGLRERVAAAQSCARWRISSCPVGQGLAALLAQDHLAREAMNGPFL
jgi:hypothetical protein